MQPLDGLYFAGGLLSCGVSQVIGVIGLMCTGVRAIYDVACRSFYERLLTETANDNPFYEEYSQRVTYYAKRQEINGSYAEGFGLALIPIFGFPISYISGTLKTSYTNTIRDIAENSSCLQKLARYLLYPLEGMSFQEYVDVQFKQEQVEAFIKKKANKNIHSKLDFYKVLTEQNIKVFHAKEIKITTQDHRSLSATWIPSPKEFNKTAIIFHGNGVTHNCSFHIAEMYHTMEWNVLMVTMGGYPGSEQNVPISEQTNTYDALAAADYLLNKGVQPTEILSHGTSLGGSLATAVGVLIPGSHVITDQTFTKFSDVAKNQVSCQPLKIIAEEIAKCSLPEGIKFRATVLGKEQILETDGLNNLARVARIQGKYLAIATKNDSLMNRSEAAQKEHIEQLGPGHNSEGLELPNSFSHDLALAYKKSNNHSKHAEQKSTHADQKLLLTLEGDHMESIFARKVDSSRKNQFKHESKLMEFLAFIHPIVDSVREAN